MKEHAIDDLIAEALTEEEREFLARLDEPSMMRQGLDLFHSRHRAFTLMSVLAMAVFFGLSIFSLTRFLGATEVTSMLRWGAALFFCLMAVMAMKVWSWLQMQTNAQRRELKRVELQLASLAQRLGGRS